MARYLRSISVPRPPFLGGGTWSISNLNEITVLFGKNGAGKSQLLRGLRNQQNMMYHYISPERAGEIAFNPSYMQEELSPASRSGKSSNNLFSTYRESVISRIQAFLAKRGNIRNDQIDQNPGEIEDMLQTLLPDFIFRIQDGNPPFSFRRVHDDLLISSVNALSSGESQVLTLALDILLICAMWQLEGTSEGVLLIDEPDCHLHPDLLQQLARFFMSVVEKYGVQMIVATHSTPLLSAIGHYGGVKTSIVYINNAASEQRAKRFTDDLQELATCLGGHALMGPLFGAPLFLVEGDDDCIIWSQVPRHGVVKLAVIPCEGSKIDQYRRTLENIFASLQPQRTTPSAYALRDGDKPDTTSGFTYIKCLNLACHESENLYLTDEVLASLGLTWEEATAKIVARCEEFGQKSTKLRGVESWDRKSADIKDMIKELAVILDEKHVPWMVRVGKCIGEKQPTGQLADFLGSDLVAALWGPMGTEEKQRELIAAVATTAEDEAR